MKPKNKIKIEWSSTLAYAIGLIATDGCLYNNGRHIAFVSKDMQLIKVFMQCLGIKVKIAKKISGFNKNNFAYWVQFGDVNFYKFLLSIGLTPKKSLTLGELKIPDEYFFDFLRGSFDGDGTFYSYWDKRWHSSYMFYLVFISASKDHLKWKQKKLKELIGVLGTIKEKYKSRAYQLSYAKNESKKIIKNIYNKNNLPRLERKYKKVYNSLTIDKNHI